MFSTNITNNFKLIVYYLLLKFNLVKTNYTSKYEVKYCKNLRILGIFFYWFSYKYWLPNNMSIFKFLLTTSEGRIQP